LSNISLHYTALLKGTVYEGTAVITHLFTPRQVTDNVVSGLQNTLRGLLHVHATVITKWCRRRYTLWFGQPIAGCVLCIAEVEFHLRLRSLWFPAEISLRTQESESTRLLPFMLLLAREQPAIVINDNCGFW